MIGAYQKTVSALLDRRGAGNADLAAEIASVPEHIRGFGHVKEAHLHKVRAQLARLLKEWDKPLRIVQAMQINSHIYSLTERDACITLLKTGRSGPIALTIHSNIYSIDA
ncbi:DUF6537 domain-containing protein [Thermomonas sp.]|uniref:DUF6537 domain-containing protein n=1 Tax=Thermomonas sp. TaxID=1971895 RepID=UPI00257E4774|nr:DUF6537 domain-containing protein [Thermomonas sp.]